MHYNYTIQSLYPVLQQQIELVHNITMLTTNFFERMLTTNLKRRHARVVPNVNPNIYLFA